MKIFALTTSLAVPSALAWFQELPKRFSQDTICGPVPNDTMGEDFPHVHYKMKHIHDVTTDGQPVEYAFGYPTTVYLNLCGASTYEMRDWGFRLVCEDGKWKILDLPESVCELENVDEKDGVNHFKLLMNNWKVFNRRNLGGQVERFEWMGNN